MTRGTHPWRVRVPDRAPVYFATETAARLRASLGRSRGELVAVEHYDPDGWHDCPSPGDSIPQDPPRTHGEARRALEAHRKATRAAARRPDLPF